MRWGEGEAVGWVEGQGGRGRNGHSIFPRSVTGRLWLNVVVQETGGSSRLVAGGGGCRDTDSLCAGSNAPDSRWSRHRSTRPSHLLILALELQNQST